MQPELTPAVLASLRRPRQYPAVSVLVPTHRTKPDNAQDPIRLRNLLAEAAKELNADPAVTPEVRQDVVRQLDQAVAELDPGSAEDGLAILASPGEHHVWTLPRTVPERVVLSDTYLTRNLVAAYAAERPYWVLAVSADRAALWRGDARRLVEEQTNGFPLTRSLEDPDAERKQQIGDLPSTYRDEQTRQFFRDIDSAVNEVLAPSVRLYVTGEREAIGLLAEVGTATKDAVPVPHGGLAQAGAEAVREAVLPAVTAQEKDGVAATVADIEDARGRKEFAAGVDEVWEHVAAGRIRVLVVEEHYRTTVREDGNHLVPAEPGDLDARDDIVDEMVEQSLETGAEVRFVPDGTLADGAGIVGLLRY
ncbi:chemotaxis protein [Streptomyces sp. NPDC046821]|uniref:baeRF3 domain-containing protein n=1 Tax=Streptomyces sp. NPDC046821 TaxID=3154702 RepID=UPI0033F0EAB2